MTKVLETYKIRELFDVTTVSSEIGVIKPDARIFMSALKSVSAKPKEAVFVSDELAEDLVGSKGLGIISVWLRNPQIKGEWKQREAVEEKIFEPDTTISDLQELLLFLERVNKN